MAIMLTENNDFFVKYARNRFIGKTKKVSKEKREFGLKGGSLKAIQLGNYHNIVAIAETSFTESFTIGYLATQRLTRAIWRYTKT